MKTFFIFLFLTTHSYNVLAGTKIFQYIEQGKVASVQAEINKNRNSVNEIGEYKQTPLIHAAVYHKTEIAEILIRNGANVNAQDIGGATALHISAREGSSDFVSLLIKNKVNKNIKDKTGKIALIRAVDFNKKDVIKLLSEQQ